jgi:hypothetical protein
MSLQKALSFWYHTHFNQLHVIKNIHPSVIRIPLFDYFLLLFPCSSTHLLCRFKFLSTYLSFLLGSPFILCCYCHSLQFFLTPFSVLYYLLLSRLILYFAFFYLLPSVFLPCPFLLFSIFTNLLLSTFFCVSPLFFYCPF